MYLWCVMNHFEPILNDAIDLTMVLIVIIVFIVRTNVTLTVTLRFIKFRKQVMMIDKRKSVLILEEKSYVIETKNC